MIVVGDELGRRVAERLNASFVPVDPRVFGDNEICPRVMLEEAGGTEALAGKECVLVLQMKAGENPNTYLVKVLFTVDVIRKLKPGSLAVAMPYFVYARQHQQYLPGQPVSAEIVAKFLENAGATRFVTINSHSRGDLPSFFSGKTFDLDAVPFLAEHFAQRKEFEGDKNVIAIGPDKGAASLAKHFVSKLGFGEWTAFEKQRDVHTGEITMKPDGAKLDGKTAIVIDDLCASGGTMVKALEACRLHGAKKTIACFVHAVLSDNALERLRPAADEIVSTNTIASAVSEVDVSTLIASAFQDQQKLKQYLVEFD